MRDGRGFTLIELIMVIVIIGILASIAIPRFMDLKSEAEIAACKGSGGGLRAAISSYYASAVFNDVSTIWPTAVNSTVLDSTYLQSFPTDPLSASWDTHYNATTGVLDVDTACTQP